MLRSAGMSAAFCLACVALIGCPRERDPEYADQPGYGPPPPGGYGYQQPPQPYPYQQPPGPGAPPPQGTVPQPGGYPPPGGTAPPPGPGQPPQPQPQPGWPFPFPPPGGTAPPPGGGSGGGGGAPPPGGGGQDTGLAAALDPASAAIATVPLGAVASQQLPGMQPTTDAIAGNFQQGQRLEQQFTMTQGKCYAAVAVGAPPISDMHIRFVALQPLPGIPNPVLAEDKSNGAQAVLGQGGNCFKWSLPIGINAKVEYIAQAGSGIAAGRVFVK